MMMKNKNLLLGMAALLSTFVVTAPASAKSVDLFDVKARRAELQKPEFATIRAACMAQDISQPDEKIPAPVEGLKETEGYGTDRSMSDFAWFIMIHGGRALAGDEKSESLVKNALLQWSGAKALQETEEVHDAYYALKRALLPTIVSYTIVREGMSSAERKQVEDWLDPLVRRVDKKFDGDVDHNNHRYLADSVLTLWGSIAGDSELYNKGRERYEIALDQMKPDGALPLETRRGARSLWYMRQSVADLGLIAEIYDRNGDDLYGLERDGKSLPLLANYLVSAIRAPLVVIPDASENVIPGPSPDFMAQDLEFLARRGGRRHYMGFSHFYIRHYGLKELSAARLNALMQETGFKELPLIDDYTGGNATCFWGQP
ncbi:MAG: alginate lyase family protein [Alphaproteobacteria bacterium]|nr:alginate lyase family protein [Alphaproteobacteria bacterium]